MRQLAPRTPLLIGISLILIVASLWLLLSNKNDRSQPNSKLAISAEILAGEKARTDQPGEAQEYYRLKRAPVGEYAVPVERYLVARERMRLMRRHSTGLGRTLSTDDLRSQDVMQLSLDAWNWLGPGNVGGRTRALLIHPTNPDIMYAAGVAGGVWKTTNGGAMWTPLTDLMANIAVCSLVMDPTNSEVIFAGTGEGFFNADGVRGAGVFKTTDGGANWTHLNATRNADFFFVNDLVISPTNNLRIYAATRTGLWRSLDGGASWSQVLSRPTDGGCLDLAIRTDQPTDYIFASCGRRVVATIFRNTTAEGSGTWTPVYSETGMGRTSLAIAPSAQNIVYASVSSLTTGPYLDGLHAILRSTSNGDSGSWTAQVRNNDPNKLNTILFSNSLFAFLTECNQGTSSFINQGWYDNLLAVDPVDPNRVWAGGIDLFRSDDGGANWGIASFWQNRNTPRFVHADQHIIVFHPQYNGNTNKVMFVGNDGGIFRTDDATAAPATGPMAPCNIMNGSLVWTSLNNNYGVTQFYHGLPYPDGKSYLGGTQDNGTNRGTDTGGSGGWTSVFGGDGGYVAIDHTNPNTIFVETTGISIRRSTNGGASFATVVSGINDTGMFINPFIMDPSESRRLWTGGQFIWRTTNSATIWSRASTAIAGTAGNRVSALAVAPTDANYVLVGSGQGFINRTSISLTANLNTVWPSVQPRAGFVSWVTFDPTNRDIAYATYSTFGGQHVWRSINAGATWSPIDGSGTTGIPDIPVHCIVVDPSNTARLFIGTDLGVFVSTDSGATWAVETTGFANTVTESLSLVTTSDGTSTLFAFTHGRGAYRVVAGTGCNNSLTPPSQSFPLAGGTGGVNVSSAPGSCSWTAASNESWITITSSGGGSGNGMVNFTVAANPGISPRAGTITIAGRSLTVTQAGTAAHVSAASFRGGTVASEAITSAFGLSLGTAITAASTTTLPTTLAGTRVAVRDSGGTERFAQLFYVSPTQVNYLMPSGVVNGTATITITSGDGLVSVGTVQISTVAPGLFAANANGEGVASAAALRVSADGSQRFEPVARFDTAQNKFVSVPIDLGPPTDEVYLVLYGTGFRFRSSLSATNVLVGGEAAAVSFAGAQGTFFGLDQINARLSRSLIGRGEVIVILTVDNQPGNVVGVNIR
ncbi:MAG: hypothetical protein L0226_18190 [Acidobacteria bacterium]|nr:hypothetical protein [Acidobacteriota bacterium]